MRPGCWCSPARSTSTPTRASPPTTHPDRFFQDSVAAAFGGTTTFLVVQQPGDRIVAGRGAVAAHRRPRVARGDRRRQRRSTIGLEPRRQRTRGRPASPSCPATIDAGVATSKAFMVFDFRLGDRRLFEAMRTSWAGAAGCSRSTARTRSCSTRPSPTRSRAATSRRASTPRTRPAVRRGGRDGARAWRSPGRPEAPVHVVHLSSAAALEEVRAREGGRRPRHGRDVPALPDPDRRALRRPGSGARAPASSSRRRCGPRPIATRCGPGWPTARSTSSPPTTSPTASTSRRPRPRAASRSTGSATARPASRRCWRSLYGEGVAQGPDHARADGRPHRDDAGAPVRAGVARARSRSVATPTSCCSTRPPDGRSAPPTSTTRATTRRTRASRSRAPSGPSSCADARSSATASSSASAGSGGSSSEGRSEPEGRGSHRASRRGRAGSRRPR